MFYPAEKFLPAEAPGISIEHRVVEVVPGHEQIEFQVRVPSTSIQRVQGRRDRIQTSPLAMGAMAVPSHLHLERLYD